MIATEQSANCYYCGASFNDEEKENPRKDDGGYEMCDECYETHYQVLCPLCEDMYDDPQLGFLVVITERDNVRPGYYRVKRRPFYDGGPVTPCKIIPDSVERIADLRGDEVLSCGHSRYYEEVGHGEICPECAEKAKGETDE